MNEASREKRPITHFPGLQNEWLRRLLARIFVSFSKHRSHTDDDNNNVDANVCSLSTLARTTTYTIARKNVGNTNTFRA